MGAPPPRLAEPFVAESEQKAEDWHRLAQKARSITPAAAPVVPARKEQDCHPGGSGPCDQQRSNAAIVSLHQETERRNDQRGRVNKKPAGRSNQQPTESHPKRRPRRPVVVL